MGGRRIAVRDELSWDNYFLDCGKHIFERDASKIAFYLRAITNGGDAQADLAGDELS